MIRCYTKVWKTVVMLSHIASMRVPTDTKGYENKPNKVNDSMFYHDSCRSCTNKKLFGYSITCIRFYMVLL